jgi:hypothetical protein
MPTQKYSGNQYLIETQTCKEPARIKKSIRLM